MSTYGGGGSPGAMGGVTRTSAVASAVSAFPAAGSTATAEAPARTRGPHEGHGGHVPHGTYGGGVWSWITTVDHKRIGILYFFTSFFFFIVGGVEALLIRLQLAGAEQSVVSAELYNALFTMHGTTMIFMALMPMTAAFFNYFIPLQIGARDVAFPRLNAFSYWVYLFGALFLNASFFFGPPDAGWFGYANLTEARYSPGVGIDFWLLGLQVLGVSSIVSALNFIITIVNLRAPGMKLMRMPLFTWMTLITAFLMILAFPSITIGLVLLMFDRFFGTGFFVPAAGGDPVLWQHLFWIFGHPEVYILILPAFGIISDVIPTFSRKPLFGYPFMVYSGILIAFLGFGVWAHHMFAVGLGPIANSVFSTMSFLIAIPTGVKIFNWIATMWGGSLRFRTPLLFAVAFVAMFIIGGISGVMHASPPADLQQTDTYFVVAHIHYVLFGGTMFALFAGLYYWFPKVTGKMMGETLGKVHFWLMLLGFNLTFFPMHFLGLLGMPRRTFTYQEWLGFEPMNLLATIGAFILALSILLYLVNLGRSLKGGAPAGANPWEAGTLEWAMPSPPPHYNFRVLPEVGSREPLWSRPELVEEEARTDAPEPHMPSPSGWPMVAAFGMVLTATGALIGLPVVLLGVAVIVFAIYRWAFQPLEREGP